MGRGAGRAERGGALPPPVVPEPIQGWRTWHLGWLPDRRPGLGSVCPWSPVVWPPRRALAAGRQLLHRSPHRAPALECSCGYYALRHPRHLFGPGLRGPVLGTVSLWGRVIEHRLGYRAEFAYHARLALVCQHCLDEGVVRRADRFLRWGFLGIRACCSEHLPAERLDSVLPITAREAERALLDAYAVDPLPVELVRAPRLRLAARRIGGGRRSGDPRPPPPAPGGPGSSPRSSRSAWRRPWPRAPASPPADRPGVLLPLEPPAAPGLPGVEDRPLATWRPPPRPPRRELPPIEVIFRTPLSLVPHGLCARTAGGRFRRVSCWSGRVEPFVACLAPADTGPARACPPDTVCTSVVDGRLRCWVPVHPTG